MGCIACKKDNKNGNRLVFSETSIHKLKIFDQMEIICCPNCGLGVVSEEVNQNDLSEYYNSTYGGLAKKYAHSDMGNPIDSNAIDYRSVSQIMLIKNFINIDESTKILEIGSGKGDFYSSLIKLGNTPRYSTFEPQKEAQDKLNSIGIDTISKVFEPSDSSGRENQYDLIIMSHSLEHFHPSLIQDTIDSIYSMLKPGGYFFCEVPNAELEKFPNAGERVVPHLTFFSMSSIEHLIRNSNLKVSFLKTCGNLQNEKDASSIIESYKRKGVFEFREDTSNKEILRNVYYDKFLEKKAKELSIKNKILTTVIKIIGVNNMNRLLSIFTKIRNPSYDQILSNECFNYREDAEFIRCLGRK